MQLKGERERIRRHGVTATPNGDSRGAGAVNSYWASRQRASAWTCCDSCTRMKSVRPHRATPHDQQRTDAGGQSSGIFLRRGGTSRRVLHGRTMSITATSWLQFRYSLNLEAGSMTQGLGTTHDLINELSLAMNAVKDTAIGIMHHSIP